MNVGILGLGVDIPERILSNQDLEKMVDTSDDWIRTRTGIRERRIADDKDSTSDLGARAALAALKDAGMEPTDIDMIVCCTFTPDNNCPSTACWIQKKIGASNCGAVDINAACSGFLYGLSMAKGLISAGSVKNVLLVASEVMSRFVDFTDRNTCVLFGDAAGAVVLGPVESPRGILSEVMGADGSGTELIAVPAGGASRPASLETIQNREHCIRMNGSEVFKFAVRILGDATEQALQRAGLTVDDLDILVPHQANIRILDAAAKRFKLGNGRVMINVDRYGNTSSATVPLALYEAREQGLLKKGSVVGLVAFGGGLTWAANILRW
jgi:3-oxoacyl-[acyl-carrier-protein] synthase-3